MTITLFTTKSERNQVNKTLENQLDLSGQLRDKCSIMSPVVTISKDISIRDFNYAYIPDFARFYYIDDIVGERNGIVTLSMSVDVLMTYRSQLQKCKVIVSRQQKVFNWYLPDPMQTVKAKSIVTTQLPDGMSGNYQGFKGQGRPEYVLLVSGGAV